MSPVRVNRTRRGVVYNVATLPEARGRGFAKLASLGLLHEGQQLGARHAVLESTDAGHPVYLRLGFEDVGSFRVMLRSN